MINLTNLQTDLEDALQRHQVAGASIAVYYDDSLTTVAAGTTNINTDIKLTTETVMHLNSITKVINATLIMQFVDEGHLKLDDLVIHHLPDFKLQNHKATERITVKMLLNHTSGIDGDLLPDYGHDEETLEKAMLRAVNMRQIHEPGIDSSYCNIGTVIAAYLVQEISGISWYQLIKEKLFKPLALKHAIVLPEDAILQRVSIGHFLNSKTKEINPTSTAFLPLGLSPAGNMMMSASDLVTFARAHIANGVGVNGKRILSEQSALGMREVTTPNTHFENILGFGLGWMVFNNGVIGHAGSSSGNTSMLYVHPDKKFAAAILTNTEHGLTLINEFMTPWLRDIAKIAPYGIVKKCNQLVAETWNDADRYVGVYENNAIRCEISEIPNGLGLSIQNKFKINNSCSQEKSQIIPLVFLSDSRFIEGSRAENVSTDLVSPIEIGFSHYDTENSPQYLVLKGRLLSKISNEWE